MDQKFISGITNRVLTFILCILPIILALLWYPDFLGDDTYIHIGFILGFLNGEGFSFTGNVTYGSTSPLWVIFGALLSLLTIDPELSVRLLSGIFSIISVFLFLVIADKIKLKPSVKFAAALSLCLNPFFLRWALSGMEATAAIAMLLFLIYTYNNRYYLRHPYLYGFLLGSAFLLRPEFIVFFFIFILFLLFVNTHHRKQTIKIMLTGIGFIASWLIFAYLHFGTIIPNTYKAKAPGGFFAMTLEGTVRNIKLLLGGNIPEFIVLAIAVIVSFIIALKKDHRFIEDLVRLLDRFRHSGMLLALFFFVSFYVYYTVKDVTIISRYTLMFIPIIILSVAALINLLTDYKTQFNISLIAVYSVLVLLIHTHITFTVVKPASDLFVAGFQNSYKEMAYIVKSDTRNENKTIALNDVGIIGCYSGAKVYDLAGLVDNDRFNYKTIRDFVAAKKPLYLILRDEIEYKESVPDNVSNEILYQKQIPGFGINSLEERMVTLYRLHWQ